MIEELLDFMYLQLIQEYLSNKSNPEHISPVINRMSANRKDIAKIFDTSGQSDFWGEHNFTVVNLNMVNITMKNASSFDSQVGLQYEENVYREIYTAHHYR